MLNQQELKDLCWSKNQPPLTKSTVARPSEWWPVVSWPEYGSRSAVHQSGGVQTAQSLCLNHLAAPPSQLGPLALNSQQQFFTVAGT